MTEPVAYIRRTSGGTYLSLTPISDDYGDKTDKTLPLYTAEQLHPRVKMTKKQHKQFENYKTNKNDFYDFWQSLLVDDVSLFKEISERNLMLAWLDDRTIEIVPEMKWFVRSKEPEDEDDYYLFLNGYNLDDLDYFEFDYARAFDTKEEAELWTNPLTEAVQLPVEGE